MTKEGPIMLIDSFNLGLLRVFESVYRHGSMSQAGRELFMTQPAISQNIKNLEATLQVRLFDRVKQGLIPTHFAQELYLGIGPNLMEIEECLNRVTGVQTELKGKVNIGLPAEFGNNIILPILAEWSREHPEIQLMIDYGLALEHIKAVGTGDLDFAFVDEFDVYTNVTTRPIRNETLLLCGTKKYLKGKNIKDQFSFYENLDFITYVDNAIIVRQWFQHHFKRHPHHLNIKATLQDVQGVARMVVNHAGVGILPLHVIENFGQSVKEIVIFREEKKPLINSISIAHLKERTLSRQAELTMNALVEHLIAE